jgi:SAM-dependent methyltransferase
MKEFNKTVNLISYTIGEVHEKDLNSAIYGKCIEDLEEYLEVEEDSKLNVLDLFAKDSYVKDNQKGWMNYTSLDNVEFYQRNGEDEIKIDIVADVNKIPIKKREFDVVFTIAAKFGFGETHAAIFEIERLLVPGGLLIASMSKYLYYRELNQLLITTRPDFEYIHSIEINYKIIESGVETAKYFCYYKIKE